MENVELEKKCHILHFLLEDVRLCVDLNFVDKILPLIFIEKVPKSPGYLVGIMNIAGISVPVIDLALRVGLQRKNPYSLDNQIILCSEGSHQAGIVVDKIIGLEQIEKNSLQMNKDFQEKSSPILGVFKLYDDLIFQLNMTMVLDIQLTSEKNKPILPNELTDIADS